MKGNCKLYNICTKIWHQVFKRPIKLRAVEDINRTKHTKLTLVFLHGIAATSDTWRVTIKELSSNPELRDVRMIALDLTGFGKSIQADWLDYDYLEYAIAIDNTLKSLHVNTPVVLVGHSMGSLIAADYATNFCSSFNIIRMILVSPPILMPEELARIPDKAYMKSYASLHNLAKQEPIVDVIAEFVQHFSSFNRKYLKTTAFAKSMNQIILNPHNLQTYAKIKIPTLIIHGRFDPLVMKSNLKFIEEINPKYVRLTSVMAHHDVSALKRYKILNEIKGILKNEIV